MSTTHIPNGTLVTLPDGTTATAYLGRGWRREQLTVVKTGGAA